MPDPYKLPPSKILTFFRDPKLRRGDKTPKVLYDDLGNRTLAKHWPVVLSYGYRYPVHSGSEHTLILGKSLD